MHRFKYVTYLALDDIDRRRVEALLFSTNTNHNQVANEVPLDILGAGFVHIFVNDGEVQALVSGRSESLNIDGHELDQHYVRQALGMVQPKSQEEQMDDFIAARTFIQANAQSKFARSIANRGAI